MQGHIMMFLHAISFLTDRVPSNKFAEILPVYELTLGFVMRAKGRRGFSFTLTIPFKLVCRYFTISLFDKIYFLLLNGPPKVLTRIELMPKVIIEIPIIPTYHIFFGNPISKYPIYWGILC